VAGAAKKLALTAAMRKLLAPATPGSRDERGGERVLGSKREDDPEPPESGR